MNVELITIGDELLIGQVVNTNSAWIGVELNKAGFNISRMLTVGDDENDILQALEEATKRASIVLITGGLGPTRDDITKKTLCKFFDTQLVFNEEVYNDVVEMLSKRIGYINQLNKDQALVPENCDVIRNPLGTAPIMWFNHAGGAVVSLPGVPAEMQYAMSNSIIPRLIEKFQTETIIHKTIHLFNIPESVLAEKLTEWEDNLPSFIKLAYLPAFGKIRLRLTGKGTDTKAIESTIEDKIQLLYPIVGKHIYGFDDEPPQSSLLKLLKEKNLSISTAESCTGGYLAHLITSISGASESYKGGIIAYSNEIKIDKLGVSETDLQEHGAVSQQVVEQMALGVCKAFNTEIAIATSGIAGPTGGTEEKPIGTIWIAWAVNGKVSSELFHFTKNRENNIVRTSELAIIKLLLAMR